MRFRFRKLIGTREFYAMVLAVVIPIIVQNAITNFVNLLDNLMVGRIGTDQMSGVAIANQLIFVFNLTIFGAVSGAGIFAAQYHGAGNTEGVRAAYRFKLYISMFMVITGSVLFLTVGPKLVSLYLTDTSDPIRTRNTLDYAMQYLRIMVVGLLPFALAQDYASTLRETGETAMPMYAGIVAVFVNLVFNYLLIFGKLGFPAMGVQGAAWATVLSRYVELAIILVYSHTHKKKHPFVSGLYRTMRIPAGIVGAISRKGLPLLINELLWSLGTATLSQIYSLRGLDVVAACNISSTVTNLFSVAFLSMGTATSIIIGQTLGANDTKLARDYATKLIAFSCMISLTMGIILVCLSNPIPLLYNTTPAIQKLASQLIRIVCYFMPFHALVHCCYFIIRSGGKTGITFVFDSGFMWIACGIGYLFAHFTSLNILVVFLAVQSAELMKSAAGITLVRKGTWINNIVSSTDMAA